MIRKVSAKKARAPRGPKRTEHADAVSFWRMVTLHENQYPRLRALFAVPNGERRDDRTGGRLKATGVRAGVSDYIGLFSCGKYHGLAIELKTMTGSVRDSQRNFLAMARSHGYRAEVARGWAEAWAIVCDHFGIPNGVQP